MTKVQPNFSFQSFQEDNDASKKQFIYQLQTQFTNAANAINATIDDISYWSKERATGETWIDGTQIYEITVQGVLSGSGANTANHGVSINQLVSVEGVAVNTVPLSSAALVLPYLDPGTLANSLGLYVTNTQIVINAGNTNWNGYTYYVTIKYTKVKNA